MTNEIHDLTLAGRIKKPSYSLVSSWVKDVWKKVDSNLIRKSFKCCGISVKTNVSEGDMIFDYNDLMVDEDKENELSDENDEENNDNDEIEYNNWNNL